MITNLPPGIVGPIPSTNTKERSSANIQVATVFILFVPASLANW